MDDSSNLKRLHSSDSDSEENALHNNKRPNIPTPWPRFLMITGTDPEKHLGSCHAVIIDKSISGMIGSDKFDITRMKNGNLLVKVEAERHARSLLNLTVISGSGKSYPIKVEPHRSLNSCKGVARSPEFKLFTQEEIVDVLASQGVSHARRIEITRNGERVSTGTVILTFNQTTLPEKIKLGFLMIKIDTFIPNPMRCFRCQKFGHTSDRCKHNTTCSVCAEEGHDDRSCRKSAKCTNCEGDHPSSSKECPVWQQEKKIQEIKVKNKIPYFEAKKQVVGSGSQNLYSNVVKTPPKKNSSTQTGINAVHEFCCPHCSREIQNPSPEDPSDFTLTSSMKTPISISISSTQSTETPSSSQFSKANDIRPSFIPPPIAAKPVIQRPPPNNSGPSHQPGKTSKPELNTPKQPKKKHLNRK